MAEEENPQDSSSSGCCFKFKESFSFFTKYGILPSLGLSLYLMDMLTDVNAAYWDYRAGDVVFAYVTIGLVFAPGLVFALYLSLQYLFTYMGEIACLKAPMVIIICPLLPLWVIARDIFRILEGLFATILPERREKLIEKREKPSRIYLLKFLEAFTEAAPQLLVRLYRVALRHPKQFSDLRTSEIIQICFSVFVLALKVVSTHQKSVSTQQVLEGKAEIDSKYRLPWFIQILAIFWWICFLLTRFEALALFTASYGYWVLLIIGVHVVLVFLFQTIATHKDILQKLFVYLFGGFVFIFAYVQFNLEARIKIAAWFPYTVFSIVVFVENSIMLTFWLFDQRTSHAEFIKQNAIMTNISESTMPPMTTTSVPGGVVELEIPIERYFNLSAEDLNTHWTTLLYIHYGVFAMGLVTMILTFFSQSFLQPEPKKLERDETFELETLNSPS